MHDTGLHDEAARFFDAFVKAFETFDGQVVARRYAAPYVSLRADGSLECFESQATVAAYFQRVLDNYRDSGCRSCRFDGLEVQALGRHCLLATVTWELLNEHRQVLSAWRESYSMRRVGASLEIFASVDHVEAHVDVSPQNRKEES